MSVEWKVPLSGHAFDLDFLFSQQANQGWSIEKSEDAYFLKSTEFEKSTEASEILGLAKRIVSRLNGLARIEIPGFQPISIEGVVRLDKDSKPRYHKFLEGSLTLVARSRLRADGKVPRDSKENDSEQKITSSLIKINYMVFDGDINVVDVLRLFSLPQLRYQDLYKVFEMIREDVGGQSALKKKRWVADEDISRFTQTAQSPTILGDEARHARGVTPPKNPMNYDEAFAIIRTLSKEWLRSKTLA